MSADLCKRENSCQCCAYKVKYKNGDWEVAPVRERESTADRDIQRVTLVDLLTVAISSSSSHATDPVPITDCSSLIICIENSIARTFFFFFFTTQYSTTVVMAVWKFTTLIILLEQQQHHWMKKRSRARLSFLPSFLYNSWGRRRKIRKLASIISRHHLIKCRSKRNVRGNTKWCRFQTGLRRLEMRSYCYSDSLTPLPTQHNPVEIEDALTHSRSTSPSYFIHLPATHNAVTLYSLLSTD